VLLPSHWNGTLHAKSSTYSNYSTVQELKAMRNQVWRDSDQIKMYVFFSHCPENGGNTFCHCSVAEVSGPISAISFLGFSFSRSFLAWQNYNAS
jgi:hypothetical protein